MTKLVSDDELLEWPFDEQSVSSSSEQVRHGEAMIELTLTVRDIAADGQAG